MQLMSVQMTNPITQAHLERLRTALQNGPVLITAHDNPDPDSLAAGKGMDQLIRATWGIPTRLVYTGVIGRAENRAMLELLTPEWQRHDPRQNMEGFSAILYLDCQPGSRNIKPIVENIPLIVIDHHNPITEQTKKAVYADVRVDVASTVTMVYQYLAAAEVEVDTLLATAMFYGIRADTNGLSRGAHLDDGIVYVKLLEKLDQSLLMKIETSGLTQEYYQAFNRDFENARIYGNSIVTCLGEMHRPDLAGELADLLFRYEGAHATLCSGIYGGELHFSIRTGILDQDAGILVQNVVFPPGRAGGHGIMAGGQIPLEHQNVHDLVLKLEKRFLHCVNEPAIARPLLAKK